MLNTKTAGPMVAGQTEEDDPMAIKEAMIDCRVVRSTVIQGHGVVPAGKTLQVRESTFRELLLLGKVAPAPGHDSEGEDLALEPGGGPDLNSPLSVLALEPAIQAKLEAAGMATVGDVIAFEGEYTDIDGIGAKAAEKIDAVVEAFENPGA